MIRISSRIIETIAQLDRSELIIIRSLLRETMFLAHIRRLHLISQHFYFFFADFRL